LANGTKRKKRQAQNGVQAIFTEDNSKREKTQAIVGLIVTIAGSLIWSWAIQVSAPITLVSLGMLLTIAGVSLSAYSLAIMRTSQETKGIRSALYRLESLVEPRSEPGAPLVPSAIGSGTARGKMMQERFPKTLAVALVEAVMLIIVYSGLVHEYAQNVNMQEWVHVNASLGGYILNYQAVFVATGTLLGAVVFQLRVGREARTD
jgi:hypothetical protein